MQIREVAVKRILNPTSIDLGEYVINPYKGCSLGCLYCYVRHNKVTRREERCWGEYVDVRLNAVPLLEKELFIKKPQRVFLGSTTECFQPLEKKYRLTARILEVLNENKVYYSILTRSPLIADCIALLKQGYCTSIYFSVNDYAERLKQLLEPRSAAFNKRVETVNRLLAAGIPAIPYFSPILPFVSNLKDIFTSFPQAKRVEFEGLNFNLGNIDKVIKAISAVYPQWERPYQQMAGDKKIYNEVWLKIKKDIIKQAIAAKKNHHLYIHGLKSYFQNKYRGAKI